VHLDHPGRVAAGPLVQAVDILGHQGVELAATLEVYERRVAGIRLGMPSWMIDPALPGAFSDLGIRHVGVDVRQLLGRRISGPQTQRPSEIRNARLSRDAGARQRDEARRDVHPAAHLLDLVDCHVTSERQC
jgi:hypothetical protein